MQEIGQALSILGAVLSIIGFQIKKNKPYFAMQIAIGVCFALSFTFLGSLSAALLNIVNIARSTLLSNKKTAGKKPYLLMLNVMYLTIGLLGIFVFSMPSGVNRMIFIFAVIATVLGNIAGTLSYWTRDGKKIRIVQLSFVSPCWIFNNCVVGSYGGVACEVFNMISIIVSFIRYGVNGFERANGENA